MTLLKVGRLFINLFMQNELKKKKSVCINIKSNFIQKNLTLKSSENRSKVKTLTERHKYIFLFIRCMKRFCQCTGGSSKKRLLAKRLSKQQHIKSKVPVVDSHSEYCYLQNRKAQSQMILLIICVEKKEQNPWGSFEHFG